VHEEFLGGGFRNATSTAVIQPGVAEVVHGTMSRRDADPELVGELLRRSDVRIPDQ
jgi:hypothetical protein